MFPFIFMILDKGSFGIIIRTHALTRLGRKWCHNKIHELMRMAKAMRRKDTCMCFFDLHNLFLFSKVQYIYATQNAWLFKLVAFFRGMQFTNSGQQTVVKYWETKIQQPIHNTNVGVGKWIGIFFIQTEQHWTSNVTSGTKSLTDQTASYAKMTV